MRNHFGATQAAPQTQGHRQEEAPPPSSLPPNFQFLRCPPPSPPPLDDGEASSSEPAHVDNSCDGEAHFTYAGEEDEDVRSDSAAAPREHEPVKNCDINDEDGLRSADAADSITMRYFFHVRERLKLELSSRRSGLIESWLLQHLKENEYILHARFAPMVLRRLEADVEGFNVNYIRDLRIWLPHVQYGQVSLSLAHPLAPVITLTLTLHPSAHSNLD